MAASPFSAHVIRTQRAICAVLQPLTGERSTGKALVKATGAAVMIPPNAYLVPAPAGPGGGQQLDHTRLLKTVGGAPIKNVAQPVEVTSSGTLIDLVSNVGGYAQNLDAGTPVRWSPEIEGVEPLGVIAAGGMAGATQAEGQETLRQIAIFEGIAQRPPSAFFQAGIGQLPSAVLAWDRATNRRKAGLNHTTREQHFRLYVGVDRLDDHNERRDQGLAILDALAELLLDRSSADGEVFSAPPIDGGEASRTSTFPGIYVYAFDFFTTWTTKRVDLRTFSPWQLTRIRATTIKDATYGEGDEITDVDVTTEMDPPAE